MEDESKTSGLEKQVEDNESESGSSRDSVSSQADLLVTAEQKRMNNKRGDVGINKSTRVSSGKKDRIKPAVSNEQKFVKSVPKSCKRPSTPSAKGYGVKDVQKKNASSKILFESSEALEERPVDVVMEINKMDQVSIGTRSVESDEEDIHIVLAAESESNQNSDSLVQGMESKIEKLEEELREVAALEISIYSVVPEHGSSSHKVHTPARRLSRLYIHACKHWNQDRRATIAKNTVSGLVLVSKACGNDVSRYKK